MRLSKKKEKSWLISKANFSPSFKHHYSSPVLHRQRAPERGKISTTFPIFGDNTVVPEGMDELLSWYAQNRESNHSTARKYKEDVLEPAIKKTFNAISCLAAVRRGRKLQRKKPARKKRLLMRASLSFWQHLTSSKKAGRKRTVTTMNQGKDCCWKI